ncbi:MAG TPA: HAD-IA family hydrolase [Candidatus Saccharimonadales bacterium]|jgi:epoxide hydrolase-like predicted phosphatase
MTAPAPISALIFDCFGVLQLDSTVSLLHVVGQADQAELAGVFAANNLGHYDRDGYVRELARVTGLSVERVETYIRHEHRLNRPLVDAIMTLRGTYKIGLLSNIGRGWMNDFFSQHQLHDLFDAVVLSGDEGIAKPDPAIYSIMTERLEVPTEQCVMIDDIDANCRGAEQAGLTAIQFIDNQQLRTQLANLEVKITFD